MNGDMNTAQNLKTSGVKLTHSTVSTVKVLGIVKKSMMLLLKLCGLLIPTMMTTSILVMTSLLKNSKCSLITVTSMVMNPLLNVNSSNVPSKLKIFGDKTTVQKVTDLSIVNVLSHKKPVTICL